MTLLECIRCGMCCILGSCGKGDEIEGVCEHLVIEKDLTTSCAIIGQLSFLGTGCFLRTCPDLYEEYKELYDIDAVKTAIQERTRHMNFKAGDEKK